jgi:hypothetical protein
MKIPDTMLFHINDFGMLCTLVSLGVLEPSPQDY